MPDFKGKKNNISTVLPVALESKEKRVNLLEIDNEFSDFVSHTAPLAIINSTATQKSSLINEFDSFNDLG